LYFSCIPSIVTAIARQHCQYFLKMFTALPTTFELSSAEVRSSRKNERLSQRSLSVCKIGTLHTIPHQITRLHLSSDLFNWPLEKYARQDCRQPPEPHKRYGNSSYDQSGLTELPEQLHKVDYRPEEAAPKGFTNPFARANSRAAAANPKVNMLSPADSAEAPRTAASTGLPPAALALIWAASA
jgi:hypothetical protein